MSSNDFPKTITPTVTTDSTQRILALDVLRGFALLGILFLNINAFGMHWDAYLNPAVMGGSDGINQSVWLFNWLLTEGTMRTIFSMLFGASVILLTSRMESTGRADICADIYYRRTLWLIMFGVIHAYVILWTGDILYRYGVIGLMLYPMRKLSPKALIRSGIFVLLLSIPMTVYDYLDSYATYESYQEIAHLIENDIELNDDQEIIADEWEGIEESYNTSEDTLEYDVASVKGNYWGLLDWVIEENIDWFGTYFYAGGFLDVLSMMLIGMGLLKSGILTGERNHKYYMKILIIGYGVGLLINGYEAQLIIADGFSSLSFIQADVTYNIGRLFIAAGHISLVLLIVKLGIFKQLQSRLAAVGKMALTNYISHSIICGILFYGIGFNLYGTMERYELYYIVFAIYAFQLVLSPLWLQYYRFGPLEWLWRSLTYMERQPIKLQALKD